MILKGFFFYPQPHISPAQLRAQVLLWVWTGMFGPGPSLWKGWWQLRVFKVGKGRVLILDPTIPQLTQAWSREASARDAEGKSPKNQDCFSLGGSGMSHGLAQR